ncbi:hypothetical protein [Kribbella sp. HUAS MG21]|uniref:EthD domain-containing protein n=1 Tax=Kribbella sp. HUAS MG21 TaxID=3160966 RepID=A0AAU7TBK2_9ACTN
MSDHRTAGTLYHLLTKNEHRGELLLPLAELRNRYPDLYERHAAKYAGRHAAMTQPVPPLDCTWEDVVFLSPVHPAPLFAALQRSGRKVGQPEPATLDAGRLDPARCVIKLMRHGTDGHYPDQPDEHDYLPLTTATLRAVNRVTIDAVARLEQLQPNDPWLPWVDVPHVLHRGPIPFDWFDRPNAARAGN